VGIVPSSQQQPAAAATTSSSSSSSSRAAIVLAKQPGYRKVFCAMLVLHMAFACLVCTMQRLSNATEQQCQCKQQSSILSWLVMK